MNKESFLDCYFNELPVSSSTSKLISSFPDFFTLSKKEPENLKPFESEDSDDESENSSMQETLSFYSALSRMTIDRCMIDDILENKHNHHPFVEIEKSKQETFKWYYKTPQGNISGPLTSLRMDDLFRLNMLEIKCKIKTRTDDNFYPLIWLIKRYCKVFKENNQMIDIGPKKVSNKILKFKKGHTARKRASLISIENFGLGAGLRARTKTYAPPPVLDFKEFKIEKNTFKTPMRLRAKTRV